MSDAVASLAMTIAVCHNASEKSAVLRKVITMTRVFPHLVAVVLSLLIGAVSPAWAQDPPQEPTPAATAAATPAAPDRTPPGEPRPYERVITKDAKSQPGLFTVHRIGERLYYEIPKAQLGKEFLWVSQIARTTIGAGEGGQAAGNRVVKWE